MEMKLPSSQKRGFVTCCSGYEGMEGAGLEQASPHPADRVCFYCLFTAFQDISAMEEEKDQLMKRVERLKKRVSHELPWTPQPSPKDWQRLRNAHKD